MSNYCNICGCILPNNKKGICECCKDDLKDTEEYSIYIYDIEVFSDDWIVVFRPLEFDTHIVIHNDNYKLKEFLNQDNIVIGGFNNKHYDDWIIMTMLNGGSNIEVKRHNDFIISGENPWEFPFIQYKKKTFKSFDLRDDISDMAISLKAIEGNLKLPIVESSVDFNINRPLTSKELEEVIYYCKNDVDATVRLYHERKEYIDSKKIVGEMYGLSKVDAIGMTNAKLAAKVLNAKYKERDDERNYTIPTNIDVKVIPKIILDFFLQIKDLSIPDEKLFSETLNIYFKTSAGECPVTYAWGGVHGAKTCFTLEATEDRLIVNYDVASLYPNSMINFGYTSRSMTDPNAYKNLVETRLRYKKQKIKSKANALKLVVNTVYGAMLNQYNDLADRWAGRSVCITNQLAMTELIVKLGKSCNTIDFININTDGIMFCIDKSEIDKAEIIIQDWSRTTKFEMERDDFKKIIQKDVNNYIGITTSGQMKTKGGYVSLYKGGDFKTNNLQVIHRAIVDYLVNGIDPAETINKTTDIFEFQQIVKTGGSYTGAYHYVNGKKIQVQKVNRIYAVKNKKYGELVKGKWITEKRHKDKKTGKMVVDKINPVWSETTIPDCPTHTYIDNENKLSIKDLDKNYYIDMAKKRIDKYINIDRKIELKLNKIEEVIEIMADENKLNVYGKLAIAREQFLASGIKKSGVNTYAEFKYFTLNDIIPVKQKIFTDIGLMDCISFENDKAILTLTNIDKPDEKIMFTSQLDVDNSMISNPIQKVGAIQTYVRRYLYLLMLDIVESDVIDAVAAKPKEGQQKKSNKPVSEKEREEVKNKLINEDGEATDIQIKSIKNGLKKLRSKEDTDYEHYIKDCVTQIKNGMSKQEAEEMLIEIGKKIEE